MFSNNMQSFIILNIYFLIVIDVALLIGIYFVIIKDKVKKIRYEKTLNRLKSKILAYLKDDNQKLAVRELLNNSFAKIVAIDILNDYAEKNNLNCSQKLAELSLDSFLIDKLSGQVKIVYLRKLAFMRVVTAYESLLEFSGSKDLDISYMSFFGLALIELPTAKKIIAIEKLVASQIIRDRIIEILSRYDLEFEEWLALLEKEESVIGKVVFIKNIMEKEEIKTEKYSDQLVRFLEDQKEVKIAAITALCNSKNEKYIEALIAIYENEENWQVRMAIAKGFSNFKFASVEKLLLRMTKDSEWWVRYDAIKSIVAMGEEGIYSLIDLSLDVKDRNISDLAYYFLNANTDVYNTVKNIEG